MNRVGQAIGFQPIATLLSRRFRIGGKSIVEQTMAYWRLHYHLVFATYQRLPLITESVERQLYGVILNKANELGAIVHAIGNIQDHMHIAVSIPPKIAVADCIKHFKGASARYVNQQNRRDHFGWQEGYGALTFGDRAMSDVVAYVRNQNEHHRQNTIRTPFEQIIEKDDCAQIGTPPNKIRRLTR